MKKQLASIFTGAALLILSACAGKPQLQVSLPDKFEGQEVELINFLDSAKIASGVFTNGTLQIDADVAEPVFAAIMVDGRTRGFYVIEPGKAEICDSTSAATGTPLNDRFASLISTLDSIENLDDMDLYVDFVEKNYNANKDNPLSSYFGIEWLKYAPIEKADSMLATAPQALKDSPKTKHYLRYAKLRAATSPGKQFTDFEGEDADGKPQMLSQLVKPGVYTLIDFWASWCPYCIKELPELASLREKWNDKGFEIVGVAVRDTPDDTKGAISKHNISWPVLYNTQRKPYEIYGFSGIPHHILIGPDGKIISRGETPAQINTRLEKELNR
ncbi:MAG: AhpC/TSA family protein [Muribaculaceae bacterium]|nr:AhpC/TSA family protein [Muribaculaceae bacterium]